MACQTDACFLTTTNLYSMPGSIGGPRQEEIAANHQDAFSGDTLTAARRQQRKRHTSPHSPPLYPHSAAPSAGPSYPSNHPHAYGLQTRSFEPTDSPNPNSTTPQPCQDFSGRGVYGGERRSPPDGRPGKGASERFSAPIGTAAPYGEDVPRGDLMRAEAPYADHLSGHSAPLLGRPVTAGAGHSAPLPGSAEYGYRQAGVPRTGKDSGLTLQCASHVLPQ
jgi:hypothetical protein